MHSSGICLILVAIISIINAIPTSLVADLKSGNFIPKNKVSSRNIQEFVSDNGVLNSNNHIAIKRGGNNNFHNDPSMLPRLSNFLYKDYHNADDDLGATSTKSLKDYEKAFQYGSSKDRLEQDVENAILKSEMYDIPSLPLNYYRYYDDNAQRNNRLSSNGYRNKRDTKLTSEEIIRLLSILENKYQHNPNSWADNFDDSNAYYRPRLQDNRQQLQQHQRLPAWYQRQHEDSNTRDEDEEEDEQWLQDAVPYPHEVEMNDISTDYGYGYPKQNKRNMYGFANNYGSHFRQANNYQKRYNNNDYYNYYLSELMRSQQEPIRALKKRQAL